MRRLLKAIAIITAAVIMIAMIYIVYVFIDYHRVEDNLDLAVNNVSSDMIIPGATYVITTFNIGYGAYSPDYSFFMDGGEYARAFSKEAVVKNVKGAADIISRLDPDFAFFQEVDTDSYRSYHVEEFILLQDHFPDSSSVFAQNYDSPYLFYPLLDPIGQSVSGIVTFSKYQLDSSLRRSLPLENGVRKLLDLDRCYSITKIPVSNGNRLCLINLHLSAFTADVSIGEDQLKMIFEDATQEYSQGNYVIIGGDFNKDILGNSPQVFATTREVPNWAKPLNQDLIPDSFILVVPEKAEDLNPTLRATDSPYVEGQSFVTAIDGFIVSDNIKVVHEAHLDEGFIYSDHNPVLMRFILE